MKFLDSTVKLLSLEEQKSLIFRKHDFDYNFSYHKGEELRRTYGESILNSFPINIATRLKMGFRCIGSKSEFYSIGRKLDQKMCISIAVIGGSVSTGITINGKLTLGTDSLAWPQKLENLLNDRYRNCSSLSHHDHNKFSKHTVVNLAARGANSATFCRRLQSWRGDNKHVIHYADLIIIDQVLNDDPVGSQYYEELLAIMLKNSSYLSYPPALLWLGLTGWGSVLRQQVQMAQAHGFPMYHIPDVFIKHPHNLTADMEDAMTSSVLTGLVAENPFLEFFIKRIYKGDHVGHLGGLSHSVIASFTLPVIEHLSSYALSTKHSQRLRHDKSLRFKEKGFISSDETDGPMYPREGVPIFVPKRVVEIFLEAKPYLFSANNIWVRNSLRLLDGFAVATDQPGRAVGLLGYSVGNMFTLIIPGQAIADNMKFGFLAISFLSSYELMGIVEVAIAPHYWSAFERRNISYHKIDCLWSKNVSITNSVDIAVSKAVFKSGSKFHDMEINVTIVESSPPRSSNKIKIFDFSVY